MPTAPKYSPTFPDSTLKEQEYAVKPSEVEKNTVTLPPLGQHAAARADDLSSRAARDGDDLLRRRDSRKRNSTNECKKTIEESPVNDTCESLLDEYVPLPTGDIPSVGVRLETTSARKRASCGRKSDVDSRVKAEVCGGAPSTERTAPADNTNSGRRHSMDNLPSLHDQEESSRKQAPSSKGLKSLLESVRASSSFFRWVAMRSRIRCGIFKFLKLNFSSKVSPSIASAPDVEDRDHSQQKKHEQKRKIETGRSPLPWSRKRPASGAGASGRCIARTAIEDDLRVNHIGQWPEPLDDEPLAAEWGLDKSEGEVLATAKRIGSVLVRVVTWNLCARPTPGAERLRDVLLPPGKFHIYAVGTEECQNSIAKSVIVHSKKEWEGLLKETLGASYEMLCGHALQATHNAVFAHRGLVPLLRNVRSSAVATGLSLGPPGTTLGNKGGVGISFAIGSTSCIFVNSHLSAHQTNVRERNGQFFQISEGLARALGPPLSRASLDAPSLIESKLGTVTAFCPSTVVSGGKYDGDSQGGVRQEKGEDHTGIRGIPPRVRSKSKVVPTPSNHTRQPSAHELAETKQMDTSVPHLEQSNPIAPPPDSTSLASPSESNTPPLLLRDGPQYLGERRRVQKSVGEGGRAGNQGESAGGEHRRTLREVFDRVVWAGDLNYRVNVSRKEADVLLSNDLHDVLLMNDQLLLEREREDASVAPFAGYREGPLNFRPTYKFDCGTDMYDSSPKQRVPAWTDRVLFTGAETRRGESGREKSPEIMIQGEALARMHLRAYRSVPELRTSDHQPVLSSFVMEFDQREGSDRGNDEEEAVTNQTSSEICSIM